MLVEVAAAAAEDLLAEVATHAIPEPVATPNTLAKAVSGTVAQEAADQPAAATFPAAEPVNVAVSGIEPVDAAPPSASAKPAAAKQAASPASRGAKKK
jgi:hypothetical protein